MDFPDVSLVLQVGLPVDSDAYTHRVGRTARAGKDGRAIILLTEAESFFLKVNRQFPVKDHPASDTINNYPGSADQIADAFQSIDPKSKQKAYSAYLGFMKGFLNKMQMKPADLVKMANNFAVIGMKSGEVPEMEKKTIGKMGLKGVPGIKFAPRSPDSQAGQKRGIPPSDDPTGGDDLSRRLRHQGIPDAPAFKRNFSSLGTQRGSSHPARGGRESSRKDFGMWGDRVPGRGGSNTHGGKRGTRGNGAPMP